MKPSELAIIFFAVTGDPLADLSEDMAAEQKARAVYENLINLTNDPDLLAPLSFLRQREVVHYQRFKELFDEYVEKGLQTLNGEKALAFARNRHPWPQWCG